MAVTPPDKWAKKMLERSANAGQDWLDGVKNPSRDPAQAAVKAAPKWKQKMQDAIASGKWEKKMAKVNGAEIAAAAERAGPSAYTQGIANRSEKITRVIADLQPRVSALQNKINSLPDVTDADREKKMIENMRGMKQIGKDRAGI